MYRYVDIWGNTRITYADDNDDGIVGTSEIRREQNYYPFGLEHKGYNGATYGTKNNLKTYQGQEFTEDLNYNMLEYKFRHYDPALGRFFAVDPLASDYVYNSTYAFQENKLGLGVELEGKELKKWFKKGIEYVARNSKGQYKQVSRKHAEKILKNNGSITHTQTRGGNNKAKNLMESVTDKQVVRHDGHELPNGKIGKDHYQKKSGDGSHVFVETAKNGAIVAAATTSDSSDKADKIAGEAVEFGSNMTDAVENFGTNVFGNNAFGQMINDFNPLNLGFSDLFKFGNEALNGKTTTTANNSNTTSTNTTSTSTTTTTTTNNNSTEQCDEDGCN